MSKVENVILFCLIAIATGLTMVVSQQRAMLNNTVTIYTPIDILYVNYGNRVVEFESPLTPPRKFKTYEGMLMYIEDITAEHSNSIINHE